MKRLTSLPLARVLVQCAAPRSGGKPGSAVTFSHGLPQIINVSAYDPKERQRDGHAFSEHDVSALRAGGASALIARAGKGGKLDEKCGNFLASSDRAGMLPGVYYRLQNHVDATAQADQFVARAQTLARGRSWNAPSLLLCADFDANSRLSDITRFMDRVESRTGVIPVAYLENSTHLKKLLSGADASTKAKLRRMPYWLALYSHESGSPPAGNPRGLVNQYGVWSDWSIWQYGGVEWEHGRSRPKVYSHGSYRFSPYFANLDRPAERNVFNGSHASLHSFWQKHGLRLN